MNILKIVFGEDQIKKLDLGKKLSNEEYKSNYKVYHFKTKEEQKAFIEGMEAIIGWRRYLIIEDEEI